jgi:hypothetical protein
MASATYTAILGTRSAMPIQGDLCDQLLPEFARLFVVFVAARRVHVVVFPIRHDLPVAHGFLDIRKRVVILISKEIVSSLIGDVDGVFRVGHCGGFDLGDQSVVWGLQWLQDRIDPVASFWPYDIGLATRAVMMKLAVLVLLKAAMNARFAMPLLLFNKVRETMALC